VDEISIVPAAGIVVVSWGGGTSAAGHRHDGGIAG
jgi:hypothetical protein